MVKIEEVVTQYRLAGQILYGTKPDGTAPTPMERKNAKWIRRRIEMVLPDVREREKVLFGNVERARNTPVPTITVEMLPERYSGTISYPDGSRNRYQRISFSNKDELRDAVARLVIQGVVDVDRTKVVVGGSATSLLTLMA